MHTFIYILSKVSIWVDHSSSRVMPDMKPCGLPCIPGAEAKYEGGGPPVSRLFAGTGFSGVWVVPLRRMGGCVPACPESQNESRWDSFGIRLFELVPVLCSEQADPCFSSLPLQQLDLLLWEWSGQEGSQGERGFSIPDHPWPFLPTPFYLICTCSLRKPPSSPDSPKHTGEKSCHHLLT